MNSISIWSKAQGLNLNASKSQAILIEHQRSKCDKQNLPPIIVNNTTIPYSSTVKNLGIYMDCHLEWNEQVNHTSKKIFSIIHSLKRLKHFLPDKLKLILVQTLVMPHFDYCDIILSNLNANLSSRLQRVHNACVRYICNIRKYDHVSPSFQTLSWLRLSDRRALHSLVLLFQILRTATPIYLASRFQNLSSYHQLSTRSHHNNLLIIPYHKTSLYSSSYTVSVARNWNSLPSDIRGCWTITSFRSKLHKFLLNRLIAD